MAPRQLCLFTSLSAALAFAAPAPVTFHKDVEPLLQAHCQTCHRPGEIGPMPLLTYQDTRKWAKAIKEAVLSRKMPPWYADSSVQHYFDDPSLTSAEIDTLKSWADAGAPEGDPKDAPKPRQWVEGWNIGVPDKIVEMPEAYQIPATGTVEYTYIILPTGFTQDTWVRAAEVRPENRALMHHAVLFIRTPGSKWLGEYPVGVPFVPAPRPGSQHRSSDGDRTTEGSLADEWLVGYVPGARPYTLPEDTAFLVKAGSDFVLQLHYTPNGKPAQDRTKIGLIFAKTPPARRGFIANVAGNDWAIPPGDPNYEAKASATLATDVVVLGASPHMHLRGKAMDLRAVYPTGESEMLFHVPRYDFRWQQFYNFASAKTLPKGTRLEVDAVFDNSPNNPNNPDPKAEVHWGDQSWEEMLLGVVTLSIDPQADVNRLFQRPQRRQVASNR